MFLNIDDIRRIHLIFWKECALVQTTKDTGEPLDPEKFTRASTLFEEELNPLLDYCINFHESRNYIKHQQYRKNNFKEYINWRKFQQEALKSDSRAHTWTNIISFFPVCKLWIKHCLLLYLSTLTTGTMECILICIKPEKNLKRRPEVFKVR